MDSQFVVEGTRAVEPETETTRAGYTFAGWYTEADGGTLYTFDGTLTADTTVYAHWTAAEVSYTVIHWWENANDTAYSYHESETKTGTTGQLTEATAKRYAVQDKNLFGNTVTAYPFTAQTIQQETVAGDGSTIVNVYYSRAQFTLTFTGGSTLTCTKEEHEHSLQNGCYTLTCTNKDWWHEHTIRKGCYKLTCTKEAHEHSERNGCYDTEDILITAKYGAMITNWPVVNGNSNWKISDNNYLANLSTMPLNGGTLYAVDNDGTTNTVPYYVEALSRTDTGVDGKSAFTYGGKWFVLHHNDITKGTQNYKVSDH